MDNVDPLGDVGALLTATVDRRIMTYDPERHQRRSIRLPGYDYALPGAYFVTICTYNREPLLEVEGVKDIVRSVWDDLPARFPMWC